MNKLERIESTGAYAAVGTSAAAIVIVDSDSYRAGQELYLACKEMQKQIRETFRPIIEQAHAAHKEAIAQEKIKLEPFLVAETTLKKKLLGYEAEEKRKRDEEALRIAAEQKRLQEEAILTAAAEAEAVGNKELAEAVINQPVEVVTPVLPSAAPKVAGMRTFREVWSAEVVDIKILISAVAGGQAPAEALLPNIPFLNRQAAAYKHSLNIPGVKAISKKV